VDLGTVANVATAAAVIIGLVFGMFEVVRARREREERAAFEVVHAMLTPEWIRSAVLVLSAPDAKAVEDLQANPKLFEAAQSVAIILETLGYSVYKRLVPLPVVDELMGGIVRIAWRKLQRYVEHERSHSGSQKTWEWFQWLAERLDEYGGRRTNLTLGAHEAFRSWRP